MQITVFWFRRDLRLEDNVGLNAALKSGVPVLPLFIFDENILKDLHRDDARVQFILQCLENMHALLREQESSLLCLKGNPLDVWTKLLDTYDIKAIYTNGDYEPYAIARDKQIAMLLKDKAIPFHTYKDQVIFEKNEILKDDGKPYTIYTPYKNKWLSGFQSIKKTPEKIHNAHFYKFNCEFPTFEEIGFLQSSIIVKPYDCEAINNYADKRDYPKFSTTLVSPHLRFGTLSIRSLIAKLQDKDSVYLSELIWREFFMQILFHFPHVVAHNFKSAYDGIQWRNQEQEFELWCAGKTGYPLVDAGMRELNATGNMHNRVRMVVASFLCKHLLIDWRWGEAYFAEKLLDYELASNNGNWQWAAGTGCDAAPYFRVFNPKNQLEKFDKHLDYIKKWNPDYNMTVPIVEHEYARKRALEVYKKGIAENR